jgi:hypothetical protein
MCSFLKSILQFFKRKKKTGINVEHIHNSSVSVAVYNGPTTVSRIPFNITADWFDELLSISYDKEIEHKYIPELHESNNFEKEHLNDILNFKGVIGDIIGQLNVCEDYSRRFKESYRDFYQVIESENISITHSEHPFLSRINLLKSAIEKLDAGLADLKAVLSTANEYEVLSARNQLNNIANPVENTINFKRENWSEFLDKEPGFFHAIRYVFQHHNQVYYELNSLNRLLDRFKAHASHKIIAGNAGTGKTHISAHLITKIKEQGDYVLFFKPKQFNGDNINLNNRLMELLQVPPGYTLNEILGTINDFASRQNKRCFIIIDALNETTKSSIGFSNIWKNDLQDFINLVSLFSHLYVVCTLRTSYIDQIWSNIPSNIAALRGFERTENLKALCRRYFEYYKIRVTNFHSADLNVFGVPLLLDLYCKLINEQRTVEKEIELGMQTYLQIFEKYVDNISKEVKVKLNLQKEKLITTGFAQSSESFFQRNEAILSVDEFSDAFDADDSVTMDNSIAQAVLEGYLIFIKDIINGNEEIVKHTQQEVGGYLLARYLSEKFPSVEDLLNDTEFKEKVLNPDTVKQHQLRLDILKFLIALHPGIIAQLNTPESLDLSWWYLYNGFTPKHGAGIPDYLVSLPQNSRGIETVLKISSSQWFNPENEFNFHFVARLLERLDVWSFDLSWTFFIYKEAESFYEFVEDNTNLIGKKGADYDKVVAKFIAYTTATTIRELRDLATVYLIEFGKKYPTELLALTEYSTGLADKYIYERLASCCYGICLINQHDEQFVQTILPAFARKLFQLQFAGDATHSVYNYIVIDSIKHTVDLAIIKGVFNLSGPEKDRLDKYQFTRPNEWAAPSEEQQTLIDNSSDTSWPEPIGMDFGIYTIPRLIDGEYAQRRIPIANVYKRIFELGYQSSEFDDFEDKQFRDFYFGSNAYSSKGKTDRLGKKYSWKGFFDYAGQLFLEGSLKVYEKYSGKRYYQRLSDVSIDTCMPNQNYKIATRLYEQELIVNRNVNAEWYTDVKIDTIVPLFEYSFGADPYIMLHGMIEQRINEEYKTRSYLLAETFFIQKNKNFEKAKAIQGITFSSWDGDNHFSPDHLNRTYFGELYWSDNIGENAYDNVSIPTGERGLSSFDIIHGDEYDEEDIGEEIKEEEEERFYFDSESTLVEYSWESESQVLKGYSEYYPALKMGKSLGLKADPKSGKILDANLKDCFQCIEFKDHFIENNFNYMRSDLLKEYMNENNLALLYQVKQHSYDTNNYHNRSMKYFIIE